MTNDRSSWRDWLAGWFDRPLANVSATERAVAAVLVHAARLSGSLSEARRQTLSAVLERYLQGRDAAVVQAAIDDAQRLDDRAVDLHRFIRTINRNTAQVDRLRILGMVMQVIYADAAGADEEGLLRLLGGLLGISDHDRGVLRQSAGVARPVPA
jgi:uncharacterized tellurite resistance protein B-like protein